MSTWLNLSTHVYVSLYFCLPLQTSDWLRTRVCVCVYVYIVSPVLHPSERDKKCLPHHTCRLKPIHIQLKTSNCVVPKWVELSAIAWLITSATDVVYKYSQNKTSMGSLQSCTKSPGDDPWVSMTHGPVCPCVILTISETSCKVTVEKVAVRETV